MKLEDTYLRIFYKICLIIMIWVIEWQNIKLICCPQKKNKQEKKRMFIITLNKLGDGAFILGITCIIK